MGPVGRPTYSEDWSAFSRQRMGSFLASIVPKRTLVHGSDCQSQSGMVAPRVDRKLDHGTLRAECAGWQAAPPRKEQSQ
jgi:hypothetical protein